MKLVFLNNSNSRMPKKFIARWLDETKKRLPQNCRRKIKSRELIIVFAKKGEIKGLNMQFRGRPKSTDVLSFDPIEDNSIGELILSPAVIKKQAKSHRLTYKHELGYCLIHGFLHLLGYEHEQGGKEARKMYRLQDKIFSQLSRKL